MMNANQAAAGETGKTLSCEKHGEYQERQLNLLGRLMILDKCPACISERKAREAEQARLDDQNQQLKRIQQRKELAGISPRNFDVRFNKFETETEQQRLVKDRVYQWAKSFYGGDMVPSLILSGGVGTGKTMLATCVANSLVKTKEVKLVKLVEMLREIKDTWREGSKKSETELIKYYSRLDLLIIDEIGVNFDSDTEKLLIFEIMDGRYQQMKPSMLISNLDGEGISKIMGERVIDRLREGGGEIIAMDWESYRK